MSEPTPAPRGSAAIARAERRLWLLDLMLGLCAALLRVVRPGEASAAFLQWARAQACAAIARATGVAQTFKTETELRLFVLRTAVARVAAPAQTAPTPPAERIQRAEAPDHSPRAPREPRQVCEIVGDDAAFRARIEALEAFLDRQADGLGAGLPPLQVAFRLCEALGLNPDWSRWLEDDWLAANLGLSRLPAPSPPAGESAGAPLCIPPPSILGPPIPAAAAEIGPQPPPPAIPDDPEILKTYVPGFKEALRQRVLEAIEANAWCDEDFTFLSGALEQRLTTNEPYMWGCGCIPMRGAVRRLLEDKLRIWPDWKRWRDDEWNGPKRWRDGGWIDDGFNVRRRNAETEACLRARGVDLGETGPYQPPRLPR